MDMLNEDVQINPIHVYSEVRLVVLNGIYFQCSVYIIQQST